jgi:hypothetical protein
VLIPMLELLVGVTPARPMLRDKAPVELEEEVEDRDANENGRGNDELHRIAPPGADRGAPEPDGGGWLDGAIVAPAPGAVKRSVGDLWHLRLVTSITSLMRRTTALMARQYARLSSPGSLVRQFSAAPRLSVLLVAYLAMQPG